MILLLTCLLPVVKSELVISYQSEDIFAVNGDHVELSCGVAKKDQEFANCSWVGPDLNVYWHGDGSKYSRRNISIAKDTDYTYCQLKISRLHYPSTVC